MNTLFELGNRYAEKSTWKDYALVKLCLFSMGITAGMLVPKKYRVPVIGTAAVVFGATYVPLMAKVFRIAKEMASEQTR